MDGHNPSTQLPNAQSYYVPEDEISLVDIWRVLQRRKTVIAIIFMVSVLAGVLVALLSKDQYAYTTAIEIGKDAEAKPIDAPENTLAKLKEIYIPLSKRELMQKYPVISGYQLDADIPKGSSQLIMLHSKGATSESAQHLVLHETVAKKIMEHHRRLAAPLSRRYQAELVAAQSKLKQLTQEAALLEAQGEQLTESQTLLTRLAEEMGKQIAANAENRERLVGKTGNDANTTTLALLMADNGIQQSRARLAELEERLLVGIPATRIRLEKRRSDNLIEQDMQRLTLTDIKDNIASIQQTHIVLPPNKSLAPVNTKRQLTVALAALLGLMLGVFAAFFAEFLAKVRAGNALQPQKDAAP